MSKSTPRLRMFAGPNGSGKSTLKSYLPLELLGVYLNADEIEAGIRHNRFLDLSGFGVNATAEEVLSFFSDSLFLKDVGLSSAVEDLVFSENRLVFGRIEVNSYYASVAADFLRRKLLEQRKTFTFETVMSHRSKVELLNQAQGLGYRTYLYFVATDDPEINISRVRNRVKMGGHSVPEEKIPQRYDRSLDLLIDAIRYTNRAYIFDNSSDISQKGDGQHTWLAEITEGRELVLKTDKVPAWFKGAVLDKVA